MLSINFITFKGPMHIYNDIKDGNSNSNQNQNQKQFKSKLNEITTGNSKHTKNNN